MGKHSERSGTRTIIDSRSQRRDHPCQNVAHACRRHTGISTIAQVNWVGSIRYQGTRAFQNRDAAKFFGNRTSAGNPILLDTSSSDTKQSACFSGMRRQDPAIVAPGRCCQKIEAVRIDHDARRKLQDRLENCVRPLALAQPGTQGHHVGLTQQWREIRRAADTAANQFRAPGCDRGTMFMVGRDRDQTGAATQCCFPGKTRCTGHPRASPDNQHAPMIAFVGAAFARNQQVGKLFAAQALRPGRHLCVNLPRDPEPIEMQRSNMVGTGADIEADLEADKRDRVTGANRNAHDSSTVRMQSRRNVQCKDRHAAVVDCRDGLTKPTSQFAIQPGTENRVRDNPGIPQQRRVPADHRTAGLFEIGVCTSGITGQFGRGNQRHYRYVMAVASRDARNDIAITGIVAGAADDQKPTLTTPHVTQNRKGGLARALHQRVSGNAFLLDRAPVEFADFGGTMQFYGQRGHCGHYTFQLPTRWIIAAGQMTDTEQDLSSRIRHWGEELGFQAVGVASVDLVEDEKYLERWLELGRHGEMGYMERHGRRRSRPAHLVPETISVICVRMDYQPQARDAWSVLGDRDRAFISRYALGRDYHKVLRGRLQRLARRIGDFHGEFGHRIFVDSAPVLEKALARNAGLGWIGKHTNLLSREAGSWFFLGEIYTDIPLSADTVPSEHCGSCSACIDICPTRAIVAPYELDARRCVSYLTIELHGSIPEEFRTAIGNRIYGCDDCQLVCPWNKFAKVAAEPDFAVRHGLDAAGLVELFDWSESEFLAKTEGSAIRRIGYVRWLRNIAVALGNATGSESAVAALRRRRDFPSTLVREHVEWALRQHESPQIQAGN